MEIRILKNSVLTFVQSIRQHTMRVLEWSLTILEVSALEIEVEKLTYWKTSKYSWIAGKETKE